MAIAALKQQKWNYTDKLLYFKQNQNISCGLITKGTFSLQT